MNKDYFSNTMIILRPELSQQTLEEFASECAIDSDFIEAYGGLTSTQILKILDRVDGSKYIMIRR